MNFRPELSWEFLSEHQIAEKTQRALRNHIKHVIDCSAFYRTQFGDIDSDTVGSREVFEQLPFTDRATLYGRSSLFLGVVPEQVVETVFTSGTGGRAMPFVYTNSDLERIAFSHALSLHGAGVTSSDRVLVLSSLDRGGFEGMAVYRGSVMTGANVQRAANAVSSPEAAMHSFKTFKPTVLITTPVFLKNVAAFYAAGGGDVAGSSVRKLIVTGGTVMKKELSLNALGNVLADLWGAVVYSLYSTTEIAVSYCTADCSGGAHAHPELVYTEIVDDSGKVLPDGEIGELVVTPLGVEGVPLVRYRTGDITFKVSGACSCGRNSVRIGPILGRKDQRFTYNGKKMYPQMIAAALDGIEEIRDYIIILENDGSGRDSATIQIAATPAVLEKTAYAIKNETGMHTQVLISNIPTIQAIRGREHPGVSILDKRGKSSAASVS